MTTPGEILARLFEAHGVEVVRLADGALELPKVAMRSSGELFAMPSANPSVKGQLDLRLEPWPGRTIVESAAAIGATDDAALRRAFDVLSQNVLHVWLAAFLRPGAHDDRVSRERWVIGGRERSIVHGHVGVAGRAPVEVARELVDTLVASLAGLDVGEGTHWVRVFTAQDGDRRIVMEALLDNQPWPELAQAMARMPIAKAEGYASLRFFCVIESERMEAGRAAALIARLGREMEEREVIELLVEHGASRDHAEQLVAFVIAAFGHVVVEAVGVRLPSYAFAALDDGAYVQFELGEQPVYVEARRYAEQVMAHGQRDLLMALAGRSADLRAVNDALHAGSKPEDLRASGTYFWGLPGLVGGRRVE